MAVGPEHASRFARDTAAMGAARYTFRRRLELLASRRHVRLGMRRDTVLGTSAIAIYIVPEAASHLWCDGRGSERASRLRRDTAAMGAARHTFGRAARVVSASPPR